MATAACSGLGKVRYTCSFSGTNRLLTTATHDEGVDA